MAESARQGQPGNIFNLFTESRQKFLLDYAKCALKKHFRLGDCRHSSDDSLENFRAGVFVTLKEEGELRGCVGFVTPDNSLLTSVSDAAVLAATEDPRFIPLSADETDRVELEITILDTPRVLDSRELEKPERSIVIGKQGLMVESSFGRGLLLPQVALEWGFDATEFLEATCLKAGLGRNCWKDSGSKIYAFDAISF